MGIRLGRIGKFGLPEALVFARAWVLLGLVDLGLRWLRFGTLSHWLRWRLLRPAPASAETELHSTERIRRWVDAAANHHLIEMTCLRRALVLQRLLAGRGVKSRLRLGVRHEDGSVAAHAWLECGGGVVGVPPGDFSVLESPMESLDTEGRPHGPVIP